MTPPAMSKPSGTLNNRLGNVQRNRSTPSTSQEPSSSACSRRASAVLPELVPPLSTTTRPRCSGSTAAGYVQPLVHRSRMSGLPQGGDHGVRQRPFADTEPDAEGAERGTDGEFRDPVAERALVEYQL